MRFDHLEVLVAELGLKAHNCVTRLMMRFLLSFHGILRAKHGRNMARRVFMIETNRVSNTALKFASCTLVIVFRHQLPACLLATERNKHNLRSCPFCVSCLRCMDSVFSLAEPVSSKQQTAVFNTVFVPSLTSIVCRLRNWQGHRSGTCPTWCSHSGE